MVPKGELRPRGATIERRDRTIHGARHTTEASAAALSCSSAGRLTRVVAALLVACVVAVMGACTTTASLTSASASASQDAELLEQVVLSMLDGEALYTVAGGVKPVSSGFWQHRFEVAAPDLDLARRVHAGLRALPGLDGLSFGVQVFAEPFEGRRSLHAYVVDDVALRRVLEDQAPFFAPFGIAAHLEADEVLAIVERLPRLERFRGYGYLFGYPDYAVDFFVEAAAEEERFGTSPAREFFHLPTFASETHRFVWAVPAGHVENEADRALRARAVPLLEHYRTVRARFIGSDRPGAVDLLRAVHRSRTTSASSTSH